MAQVNIIRHNSIAVFSNPTEVLIRDDNGHVVRLVEPSGNVGTQYANDVGSEWFGTIENLNKGLQTCGVHWSDVYKTDVLWTTPSADRDACDARKNDFNKIYGALINAVTGGPLRSNRMARFTHQEGFPDPAALFEVQIKAAKGDNVTIGGGKVDYGTWIDHQPSGASVLHKKGDQMITTLGDDLVEEMNFILEEQYAKPFAEQGVDFRKQTVFMEILVAVDDDPAKTWERIEITRKAFVDYFGDDLPAGLIYPVSRIPNLDSIIEPQPRVVSGEVDIIRSGQAEDGFSTWTAISHHGVREVMVSAVAGDDAGTQLSTIDARVKEAGGQGLKENGIFNNAYIGAGSDTAANRAGLGTFNESFSAYYAGSAPAGRTAQFVGGIQREGAPYGISNRSIFAE
jgi:enamine deaminase RidA (YjgF/YER057c/UK114 family)